VTPPVHATHPEIVSDGIPPRRPGWVERATSADHKSVGLMYIAMALGFLAVALVEFVMMRIQLIVPENTLIEPQTFDRILSVSGATTVFLFALPLMLGLISYLVPLQIGSRGIALPRLGLLSFWLYAAGATTIYASFLWTPPEAGFAALPPLSDAFFSPSAGVDAWVIGVGLAVLGFACFAINLLVTVRNMRAPGMAWRRLPLFSWAGTMICGLQLFAGTLLLAALTMLLIDRHFDGVFFDSQEGGAPLLYQHLAWIFFSAVFASILVFAFGVICEILPVFARKPLFSRRTAMGSIAAVAVLALLSWMQNMYSAPLGLGLDIFAMLMAIGLLIPIGLLVFDCVATLWHGAVHFRAAVWYSIAAISALSFGLAGKLMSAVVPVGWQLDHTTAAQQDTIVVLVGGAVFGGFAALHYWFPKLSGRLMGEGIGRVALLDMALGLALLAVGMFLAGVKAQPVDVYKYFQDAGVDGYNLIASIGSFILAVGVLLEVGNAAWSYRHGVPAGHDPWGGSTLEWFALSPPPIHNFDAVPDVRSAEPLPEIRETIRMRTASWAAEPATQEARADGDGSRGAPVA